MPRTRVETRARARVLQALYAWDLRRDQQLERVATQIWDDLSVSPDERRLAGVFVRTLAKHGEELDKELADVTTNWRLERLGVIDR
ncbi:MAG TPA: transcription antitermination factor NusB, partial [Gemmatimonadaceae bacterium]|nr:transcription antitermination factor NusB [Gemmatimonadaceae bacterium]